MILIKMKYYDFYILNLFDKFLKFIKSYKHSKLIYKNIKNSSQILHIFKLQYLVLNKFHKLICKQAYSCNFHFFGFKARSDF